MLILSIIFLLPTKVYSIYYSDYTRYSSNSLIQASGLSDWENKSIRYPNVIYDNGIFKMWYSGHDGNRWSIGYAQSIDGLNWFKYPNNPILLWNGDTSKPKHFITPSVLKENNTYRMWFTSSFTDISNDWTIGYAESDNGIDWNIIDYDQYHGQANWGQGGYTHPFVNKIGLNYFLWFSSKSSSNQWQIGYATSIDGFNWIPYSNNPIIKNTVWWERGHSIGPHVIYNEANNRIDMWYNTTNLGSMSSIAYTYSINNGTTWIKPDGQNPILINEISNIFDSKEISDGSIFIDNSNIYLWYGGNKNFMDTNTFSIGLAYLGNPPTALPTPTFWPIPTPTTQSTPTQSPTPTPTSSPTPNPTPSITPTPSLTPSPSPTPTPTPKAPIVIIPGIFASWNHDAFFNYQNTSSQWHILSFVKEYDGIITTLKNLGYEDQKNVFLWAYDWRKSIDDSASQLKSFIATTVKSRNLNDSTIIIGHSLGGLVGRTFLQSLTASEKEHISLITVGSPNRGAVQPYSIWSAGVIPYDNSALTVGANMLLHSNKLQFRSPKDVFRTIFPIAKDLLPDEPYLILGTTLKPKTSMTFWNDWLETLNNTASSIVPYSSSITGLSLSTSFQYKILAPSLLDKALQNWEDGKPVETVNADGDNTVVRSRSYIPGVTPITISKNHGELIASQVGIEKILTTLSIPHSDTDIVAGSVTNFTPSLLFLLRSPATFTVSYNGNTVSDDEGLIFLPNALSGTYTITVTGTQTGTYHLDVGQFGTKTNQWMSVPEMTKQGEKDIFYVSFQADTPLPDPFVQVNPMDYLNDIEQYLTELDPATDRPEVQYAFADLYFAKKALQKKQYLIVKVQLEKIILWMSKIRKVSSIDTVTNLTYQVDDATFRAYGELLKNQSSLFPMVIVKTTKQILTQELKKIETKLITLLQKGTVPQWKVARFQRAQTLSSEGNTFYDQKLYAKAFIRYIASQLLILEPLIK